MTEAADRLENIKSLEKQLAYLSARKMSAASRKSRNPAQIIDAPTSMRDSKGNMIILAFKLAMNTQMNWYDGQSLTYRATCPCCKRRNAITVEATYLKSDAVFPDTYPTRCGTCQGGVA